MKILQINTIQQMPQFQCNVQYRKIQSLKNIPDTPCACCGNKTITADRLLEVYRRITRPLKVLINSGVFSTLKEDSPIMVMLKTLSKKNPKKSLDQIVNNTDNKQRIKNSIVQHFEQKEGAFDDKSQLTLDCFNSLLTRSRQNLRSSAVVMKKLSVFKKYFDGYKLETFEQLERYAQKYPKKTLSEIIQIEEIYNFHRTKDLLQRAETTEKREFHFNNIKKMITKANPSLSEQADLLREETIDIYASVNDPKIRVYKAKELYSKFLQENNCEKLTSKIFKEIDKLPLSYITTDSFLTFAHNNHYSDIQILYSLLTPYTGSFEHIIPESKGGKRNLNNALILCRSCNTARGTMPYSEYLTYHPEMKKNVQKQINFISNYILHGTTQEDLSSWPIKVAQTIQTETNGIIQPDISRYCERAERLSREKNENCNEKIESLNGEKKKMEEQRKELHNAIKYLNRDISSLGKSVDDLKTEMDHNNELLSLIDEYKRSKE